MVDHLDPRYRPIVYDVAMKPEQIHQWASEAGPHNGNRTRAAQAGRRGGHASSQVSRGDNLSPLPEYESPQASRGDNLPPPETEARGDNNAGSGVTSPAPRGDSPVTRTVLEPSRERSSSPAVDAARGGVGLASNGGGAATPTAAALEVLPGSVRGHPSVIPTAVAARVRILVERGWPISEVGADDRCGDRRCARRGGSGTAGLPAGAGSATVSATTSAVVRALRPAHSNAGGRRSGRSPVPVSGVPLPAGHHLWEGRRAPRVAHRAAERAHHHDLWKVCQNLPECSLRLDSHDRRATVRRRPSSGRPRSCPEFRGNFAGDVRMIFRPPFGAQTGMWHCQDRRLSVERVAELTQVAV
jgi:hypothetical protein